jgi:hypothetical protein
MYFVDETGHEDFADPNFPIFGMGGCGMLAAAIDQNLRGPWREMKARYFGGADVPLHASDLRSPTPEQIAALNQFFATQTFGRFAVTMTKKTELPDEVKPIQVRIPTKSAGDSERRRPPVPIEAGRGFR